MQFLLDALEPQSLERDLAQVASGSPQAVLVWVDGAFEGEEAVKDAPPGTFSLPLPCWRAHPRCSCGLTALTAAAAVRDPSFVLFERDPETCGVLQARRYDTVDEAVEAMLFGETENQQQPLPPEKKSTGEDRATTTTDETLSSISMRGYCDAEKGESMDGTEVSGVSLEREQQQQSAAVSGQSASDPLAPDSPPGGGESAEIDSRPVLDPVGTDSQNRSSTLSSSSEDSSSSDGKGPSSEEESTAAPGAMTLYPLINDETEQAAPRKPAEEVNSAKIPLTVLPTVQNVVSDEDDEDDDDTVIDSDDDPDGLVFPVCRKSAMEVLQETEAPQIILFTEDDPPRPVQVPNLHRPPQAGFCVAGPRQSEGIEKAAWCPPERPFVGAFFPDGTVCCVDQDQMRNPSAMRALVQMTC